MLTSADRPIVFSLVDQQIQQDFVNTHLRYFDEMGVAFVLSVLIIEIELLGNGHIFSLVPF